VLRPDDEQLPGEAWPDVEAEVAVPAATSYAVAEAEAERLRVRLVAEAANVPLTAGAERRLLDRGVPVIPDFVANAGAVAWAWWVIFGLVTDADDSRAMTAAHVRPLVDRLMAAWNEGRVPLREHARELAVASSSDMERRFGSVHEEVPLFDAGALVARLPATTTERGSA
jgi:glutamate dehydrogenase (NAD(P)+)